jgi:hypothetical protein
VSEATCGQGQARKAIDRPQVRLHERARIAQDRLSFAGTERDAQALGQRSRVGRDERALDHEDRPRARGPRRRVLGNRHTTSFPTGDRAAGRNSSAVTVRSMAGLLSQRLIER